MPATASPAPPRFSSHEFRAALGHFSTGVTIVTCLDDQLGPVGLTVNSFNSVSLDPPLVLWSLAHKAGSMAPMRRASHYAINVLAAGQQALAERFARKDVDRFAGTAWRAGTGGAPLLEDAAAIFECRSRRQYVEGDHTIFVGEVKRCAARAGAQPLVFHAGRFLTAMLA